MSGCVCGCVGGGHGWHGAVVREKLDSFGDALSLCLRYIYAVASVVKWGCVDAPTFLAAEVPFAPLLWDLVDEDFHPWRGHGGLVVVKLPI